MIVFEELSHILLVVGEVGLVTALPCQVSLEIDDLHSAFCFAVFCFLLAS